MAFTKEDLQQLLALLEITEVEEIDCGEFLHRASAFIERFDPDATPPPGFEHVIHHLRVCPECVEEFTALYRALRDPDGDG